MKKILVKMALIAAIICIVALMALFVITKNEKKVLVIKPETDFTLHDYIGRVIATAKVEGNWTIAPEGELDRFSDLANFKWVSWTYNTPKYKELYASDLGMGFWAKKQNK